MLDHHRCVAQTPRRSRRRECMVEPEIVRHWRVGEPARRRRSGVPIGATAGSSSHSISISSTASSACARCRRPPRRPASPCQQTSPRASGNCGGEHVAGEKRKLWSATACRSRRDRRQSRRAITPGDLPGRGDIDRPMRACAMGLRRKATCPTRANAMSSV